MGERKPATGTLREAVRTTCPRDCYDACGIVVVKRDGGRHRVRGDPDHPVSRGKLCRKCTIAYNGAWQEPEARLLAPLRRVGPKGAGHFEEIGWDEALAETSQRLSAVVATVGAEAILNTHYTGTLALLGYCFPQRFFNRLGATEVDPDTICNNAGHVALEYVYGTSLEGFDPRTARDSACIMIWGANPSVSAPHQHQHWLPEAPGAVVVIDPIRTESASAADIHLQPFPGSDAALAFGLMHVLRRDGLVDRDFLASHSVGFDELDAELAPCTPSWTQAKTGVPADLVERTARVYGEGPSLLWIGQGLQRQPTGGNIVRAISLLPAVTGNLGKPGAGFLYLNGPENRGVDGDYVTGKQLASQSRPSISHMDLVERLEDTERARALFCWNINIAASNPEQRRLHAALAREDLFMVVSDVFQTDTVDFADIVLPAASFLEHDDLVASYFNRSLSAQVKVSEPLGDSLPNPEIFRRLAWEMGFSEPELYEGDREIIGRLLEGTEADITFEELAERGTIWPSREPVRQFADLRFPTPSGRVEIASASADRDGLPRVPQPTVDAPPTGGRLRLISPASFWMLNDSYANEGKIVRQMGPFGLQLNPDDARSRGLRDGDRVVVRSAVGELELPVTLSAALPSGVACAPKGRWPKREQQRANINVLNPGGMSDMGRSTSVHGMEVTVEARPERDGR